MEWEQSTEGSQASLHWVVVSYVKPSLTLNEETSWLPLTYVRVEQQGDVSQETDTFRTLVIELSSRTYDQAGGGCCGGRVAFRIYFEDGEDRIC